MGDKKLYSPGAAHAASLIEGGEISDAKSWSAPDVEKEDAYIDKEGLTAYAKWHLGVDAGEKNENKGKYAFPFSNDFKTVNLEGLRACISRAGQSGYASIKTRAKKLYGAAKKKMGKPVMRADAKIRPALEKLSRKAAERMQRDKVLVESVKAGGYSISDLQSWLCDEIYSTDVPELTDKGDRDWGCGVCCWAIIAPPHEKGETWKGIVRGNDGELYEVEFVLGEDDVTVIGTPKKVEPSNDYKYVEETEDDEAVERSGKTGMMYRYMQPDVSDDGESGDMRLHLSLASENPALQKCDDGIASTVARSAGIKEGEVYIEIMDHSPENVDLSMLNNRGAMLDEHDEKDHIGAVEKAVLNEKEKRTEADVVYDNSAKGKLRHRQAKDKIRPHISAGYKHTRYVGKTVLPNGKTAHRFAWKGLEVSSVAVPSDPTIGVERSDLGLAEIDSKTQVSSKSTETKEKFMADKTIAELEAELKQLRADSVTAETRGRTSELQRRNEFFAIRDGLVKDYPKSETIIRKMVDEAICDEKISIGDLQIRALKEIVKAKPAVERDMKSLGYDEQERGRYSLMRAIKNVLTRSIDSKQQFMTPDPDTLEGDVHKKMAELQRSAGGATQADGFWVPSDANVSPRTLSRSDRSRMQRDMTATTFGNGGAAVATELLLPIIEILRNEMVTSRMGITTLSGLEGNIVIPRQTAAATAYAVPEIGALTASNQVLDQISLTPKRVGATNNYSKQLLLQSSMDIENFIRTDFFAIIALLWDYYILNGQGGNSQPLGMMNTPGINQIVLGGSATWANIVQMETNIAQYNARKMGRGYVTTSAGKGRLKTLAKLLVGATTVAAVPLWEDQAFGYENDGWGLMNGYRAMDSQQIPNNQLLFAVWPTVIQALWGGLDVVVNPYSLDTSGEVRITMNTFGDVAVRHPQEICVTADSAAQ